MLFTKLCRRFNGQGTKSIFSNDDALKKMLYSAYRDISKKWTVMPVQNWSVALSHLSVIFDQRLKDVL